MIFAFVYRIEPCFWNSFGKVILVLFRLIFIKKIIIMQVFYNTHPQAKTIKKNTEKTIKKPQRKSGAYFFWRFAVTLPRYHFRLCHNPWPFSQSNHRCRIVMGQGLYIGHTAFLDFHTNY